MYSLDELKNTDPAIAQVIEDELARQNSHIELIASENWVSHAVMAAMGSPLTNKYAEGYPGKRYYGGCECVDVAENLAIERAKELFGCDYANVQPHSGAQANLAVFFAMLEPGDTVMGMNLDHGGHLTHGSPVNISGKYFKIVPYGVNDEGFIDYDELRRIALEAKPKLIVAGASAYARTIDFKKFREVADEVGAYLMVDMAHIAGLVAAGVIPSPIPYADFVTSSTTKTFCSARSGMVFCKEKYAKALDKGSFPGALGSMHLQTMAAKCWSFHYAASQEFHDTMAQVVKNAQHMAQELIKRGYTIVSGGTDNHLLVVDLRSKGVTGRQMQDSLEKAGISVNKQVVPFDTAKPNVTSGIRIGLTSVTQRGVKEEGVTEIVEMMDRVVNAPDDEAVIADVKAQAEEFISRYPLYSQEELEELK